MRSTAAILVVLFARQVAASPNVSLDDPAYEALQRALTIGDVPAFSGGFAPLTERRIRSLLGTAPMPNGWWLSPVARLRLTGTLFQDAARPYSTTIRPRNLTVGHVSIACERQEGRPCGDGAGLFGEIDSSAGYGAWVSASVRLRAQAGQEFDDELVLDRAYVNAEIGAVAAEVGRDVVVFGPSGRTQLGWGTNAPPITHVRISTSEPFQLGRNIRGSAHYLVGRLRSPQRYPRGLITIGRIQLDIGGALEIGTMQLLQLGGVGAPTMGVWDFIAEHIRRKDLTASDTDSSNRRFGGDISLRIRELRTRLYYSLIFEDIRRARLIDAIRYDADHLVGLDLALDEPGRHALLVEWHQSGFRSQEHYPRTTGFTNLGRVVGTPLGPDAESVFIGYTFRTNRATLYPWVEVARLASDTYQQVTEGPIDRIERRLPEWRYRGGTRARLDIWQGFAVEIEAQYEHVNAFAFDRASKKNNSGALASVVWFPGRRIATPASDQGQAENKGASE